MSCTGGLSLRRSMVRCASPMVLPPRGGSVYDRFGARQAASGALDLPAKCTGTSHSSQAFRRRVRNLRRSIGLASQHLGHRADVAETSPRGRALWAITPAAQSRDRRWLVIPERPIVVRMACRHSGSDRAPRTGDHRWSLRANGRSGVGTIPILGVRDWCPKP